MVSNKGSIAEVANPSASAAGLSVLGGSPTQVTGPAYQRLDLSLFRKIALADQIQLELRAEIFNITSTRDNARQLQFAGKIYLVGVWYV